MSVYSHKSWAAAALVVTLIASGVTVRAGEADGVTRVTDQVPAGSATQVHHNTVVWQGSWTTCDNGVTGRGMLWPDAGWNRPMPTAVRRAPVVYSRRWPQTWHGQSGAARVTAPPTVYQPTDTTQLGFIYHRVPQWQPNPQMLPRAPWPATWHSRRCPSNGCFGAPTYVTPVSPQMAPQPVPPQPTPQKTAANGISQPVGS
ncbi:MAG: hypothetical protein ABGZ17_32375 [Planctomycetaceae bacterium]